MKNKTFTFSQKITQKEIDHFIQLTADKHPLHTDSNYARKKGFKTKVVHGMLTASFFSTLVGMYLPERQYMYLSQTLTFHKPIYPDTTVRIQGTVTHHSETFGILTLRTEIFSQDGELMVSGEAKVKKL